MFSRDLLSVPKTFTTWNTFKTISQINHETTINVFEMQNMKILFIWVLFSKSFKSQADKRYNSALKKEFFMKTQKLFISTFVTFFYERSMFSCKFFIPYSHNLKFHTIDIHMKIGWNESLDKNLLNLGNKNQ